MLTKEKRIKFIKINKHAMEEANTLSMNREYHQQPRNDENSRNLFDF